MRRAIQHSQESLRVLARRYGIDQKTVAKWKRRTSVADIKEATVKRDYHEAHDELRTHIDHFVQAYNDARRLKTLNGLSPYEFIGKAWTKQPARFTLNPIHQMPALNI